MTTGYSRKPKHVDMERVEEAIDTDEMVGFCLACGSEHDNVEPDAEKYLCTDCGRAKVYGAEQILIMCL